METGQFSGENKAYCVERAVKYCPVVKKDGMWIVPSEHVYDFTNFNAIYGK